MQCHIVPPPPPPTAQDIRSLDKEMRAWDAFTGLDSLVKNMVTSLRAVGELQNPAIRDRHWEQLMQATQVPGGGGPWMCIRAWLCFKYFMHIPSVSVQNQRLYMYIAHGF